MYKKIFSLLCFVALSLSIFAQQDDCYEMTKLGASVRYGNYSGRSLMGYIERTVIDVREENGKKIVSYDWKMLNKKGKPSKAARLTGMDQWQTSVKFENGSYYLTFDFSYGGSLGKHSGYLLKIPQTLQVGDELEGGTLNHTSKYTGITFENECTFENWKVVEEVDLNTAAGSIHCMKIQGHVSGKYQGHKLDYIGTIYLAKNIGIVCQETPIYSMKVEASQINLGE